MRALGVRLFTSWNTLVFVDGVSGELRHGPIGGSPENALLILDRARPIAGWIVQDRDESTRSVAYGDRNLTIAGGSDLDPGSHAGALRIHYLERGIVAIEKDGTFLSAEPDGGITSSKTRCSLWEFFVLSEVPPHSGSAGDPLSQPAIDQNWLRSYTVDPRLRVQAMKGSPATKILIFGYRAWSHGRVYYDLCKQFWQRGYVVDVLDWQVDHTPYMPEILRFYDLVLTALNGVQTLINDYGLDPARIVAVSHSELDLHLLIEQRGVEAFSRFGGYGVVSEFLYSRSPMLGISRLPKVVPLGVDMAAFRADLPGRLETVGYASSMSASLKGYDYKRGHLAASAAREAGLQFRVAGSTTKQIWLHDMPDFYRSVDAVLVCSTTEAAGLPAMEAAAAGRLVIGTPVGNFPQHACRGAGILAPIEPDEFFASAAATLRHYKENPSAFVEKCRAIGEAAESFDWQHTIDSWIELIERSKTGEVADTAS